MHLWERGKIAAAGVSGADSARMRKPRSRSCEHRTDSHLAGGYLPACAFQVSEINDNGCNPVQQLQCIRLLARVPFCTMEMLIFSHRPDRLTCKGSQIRVLSRPLFFADAARFESRSYGSAIARTTRSKNASSYCELMSDRPIGAPDAIASGIEISGKRPRPAIAVNDKTRLK
jgi:hypothetical protein